MIRIAKIALVSQKHLQKTKPQNQRIVLLEAMALVFAEHVVHVDNIHPEEKRVIDEMMQAFNLTKNHALIYSE